MNRGLRELRSSKQPPHTERPAAVPDVRPVPPLRYSSTGDCILRLLLPILIAAITVAVFSPAMTGQFLNWDDDFMFLLNLGYRGLDADHLKWMFMVGHMGHYQPLAWITLAIDHHFVGMKPELYHVMSVVWHAATAVLFYFLARRLIALGMRHEPLPASSTAPLPVSPNVLCISATLAALLFSVHPLRVESVAWVTERRDVVSGFFFVAALLTYLRAVSPGLIPIRSHGWHFLCVVCVALSLMAKAWGMALPIIMLVLDIYPLGRLPGDPRRWRAPDVLRIIYQKLPALLLAFGAGIAALLAQRTVDWGVMSLTQHKLDARIAQAIFGMAFYPLRTLLPQDLATIVQIPKGFGLHSNSVLLAAGVVLLVTTVSLLLHRRYPALLAVWVCYLVTVFPVLGVAQSGQQLVADRYSYLSCLGFPLLLAGAVAVLVRDASLRWLWSIATAVVCLVVVIFGVMSYRYTTCWRTSESLWAYTVPRVPDSWIARINYGTAMFINGKVADAADQLRTATELNPKSGHAWHNYGVVLSSAGRDAEAEQAFIKAVEFYSAPRSSELQLGYLYLKQKRFNDAIPKFIEAMPSPDLTAQAHGGLGSCYLGLGQLDAAIAELEMSVRLDPSLQRNKLLLERALRLREKRSQ